MSMFRMNKFVWGIRWWVLDEKIVWDWLCVDVVLPKIVSVDVVYSADDIRYVCQMACSQQLLQWWYVAFSCSML